MKSLDRQGTEEEINSKHQLLDQKRDYGVKLATPANFKRSAAYMKKNLVLYSDMELHIIHFLNDMLDTITRTKGIVMEDGTQIEWYEAEEYIPFKRLDKLQQVLRELEEHQSQGA